MAYTNHMDTNLVFDFKMIDNSEADIHNEMCMEVNHRMTNCSEADINEVTCTKVDHIMNNCSHNVTSSHPNNTDNNKTYAISSGCAVDNYTQLVFLTNMDRTSNNYSDPPNTSHMRPSTVANLEDREDENQGNNPLQIVSTVGLEVIHEQKVHVPDASNGMSEHYLPEAIVNDVGTIITTSTGGYNGDRTGVGHFQDNNMDSTLNHTDNQLINKPQGKGIHASGQTSDLAYAVTPWENRELWCTWGSWAGGSPGPINSSAGEGVQKDEVIRMNLTPASRQAQAHRIAVLHEGTKLSIPAAAPFDLQHSEEGMEGREVGERKYKQDDPPYRLQELRLVTQSPRGNRSSCSRQRRMKHRMRVAITTCH
jgi:hypothetical protein